MHNLCKETSFITCQMQEYLSHSTETQLTDHQIFKCKILISLVTLSKEQLLFMITADLLRQMQIGKELAQLVVQDSQVISLQGLEAGLCVRLIFQNNCNET